MWHNFKNIAQNWSYRGYTTDSDIDSFIASSMEPGAKSIAILIGGLFRLIDENGSTNRDTLSRLIEVLERIEKRIDDAQRDSQRNVIADAMLMSLIAAPENLVSLDDSSFLDGSKLGDARVRKAIHRSGCKTPMELAAFGADNLLGLRNVGVNTVRIIRDFLHDNYGLTLAE